MYFMANGSYTRQSHSGSFGNGRIKCDGRVIKLSRRPIFLKVELPNGEASEYSKAESQTNI